MEPEHAGFQMESPFPGGGGGVIFRFHVLNFGYTRNVIILVVTVILGGG